jgi:hypothetical protein
LASKAHCIPEWTQPARELLQPVQELLLPALPSLELP